MIDFVKFIPAEADSSLLRNLLKFEYTLHNTGEIRFEVAEFHQMKVKIFHPSERVEVRGSLHKCFNSISKVYAPNQITPNQKAKGFNGNDFNYTQLIYTIDFICRRLFLNSENCTLTNIEFGLNLKHNYNSRQVLNNLFRHSGKEFRQTKESFFEAAHIQYFVKCYNKSKQYKMSDEIIRIEIKHVKMEKLNALGLTSLNDLRSKALLTHLNKLLVSQWQGIVMYDYTIRESELKKVDKNKLDKYKNANYWNMELKPKDADRPKKALQRIVQEHSNKIQDYFSNCLAEQWKELQKRCITVDRLFKTKLHNH
jgi:hypothetical protein